MMPPRDSLTVIGRDGVSRCVRYHADRYRADRIHRHPAGERLSSHLQINLRDRPGTQEDDCQRVGAELVDDVTMSLSVRRALVRQLVGLAPADSALGVEVRKDEESNGRKLED